MKSENKKLKKTTISIDTDVWAEINRRLRIGTRDNKNKVLRRLLGLGKDGILVIEGAVSRGSVQTSVNGQTLFLMLRKLFDGDPNLKLVRITIEEVK